MRTVQRYIHGQIYKAVLFVCVGFLGLFSFFDVISELTFTSRTPIPYGMKNALVHTLLLMPGHTYELLPIALLIGAIFVMAGLAQSSEFTILRTGGLGPGQALRSLLWLGALFTVLTFVTGDYIAPRTEKLAQFYKAQFEGNITAGRTGAWIKENVDGIDRIVNIGQLTAEGQMRDLRIFDFDQQGALAQMRKAETGEFADNGWRLGNVSSTITQAASSAQTESSTQEASTTQAANKQQQGGSQQQVVRQLLGEQELKTGIKQTMVAAALLNPNRMSTYELYRYISHLKANNQSAQSYEVQFWRRLFYPLSCLVMVMLALPFAYLHFRSGNITTVVFIGVVVGVSFFLLNNLFGYIANLREWLPWVSAAVPSLIYMALSLFAFRWLVRYR